MTLSQSPGAIRTREWRARKKLGVRLVPIPISEDLVRELAFQGELNEPEIDTLINKLVGDFAVVLDDYLEGLVFKGVTRHKESNQGGKLDL